MNPDYLMRKYRQGKLLNPAMSRRKFLISASVLAGGLSLQLIPSNSNAAASKAATPDAAADEFSPWLKILPDDTVVVSVPTPEIGNGSSTQQAMNIAEELECAWQNVKVEFASYSREHQQPGSYAVGLQPFFGGHSTDHDRMPYTLQLGASARERLKLAAAKRWGVPVTDVVARDSVLSHKASGRTLRFGEVAQEAAGVELSAEPSLKPQAEWRLLGKTKPHKLQLPEVVKGTAVYGIDVTLPGMVYAAILQCPVHGGLLKSHDPKAVLDMPGVKAVVVIDPAGRVGSPVQADPTFGFEGSECHGGVAVIAEHYWQAKKALDALPVEWDLGLGPFWSSEEKIHQRQDRVLEQWSGSALTKAGDVSVPAAKTVEATYRTPFCEHAAMEPLNGTAIYTKDGLEFWHPTQDMQQAFWVAVDESGLQPDQVTFHQTLVGGGFGRRVIGDDVRAVVAIARQYPGVPVKVIWSREETTRQGSYRTPVAARYKAGLDEQGALISLQGETCFSGMELSLGYSDMVYAASGAIPNMRLATSKLLTHIATGAYRAPCYNSHAFTVESIIDECAVAAAADPLDFRLKLLENWDPAWSDCLNIAAQKASWGESLPKGQGRGIAISNWPHSGSKQAGSTVCAVAHVEVSQAGELKVHRIDFTFDCGRIVNKDAVMQQLQGGIVFGLNMALNEGLTIKDGAIMEGNFDGLPLLKMADIPEINIHFDALSGHDRFAIIGEAPVGPVGPAIANAIYQATGKRVRSMPFRKQDLSWS
ncbi:xanthine dehydrogenase family protein molybdopterin-binding subunit [Ketobacter sp. MCCC 1A13808]|uniref:xanthine dehydrogenase family protein molybdopterin-binding subunit n=1 Tax=Ketobacter sp. MCCC 1A13808 TaxID=2602738 RepID=UPI000F1385DF|nr:molybdopterin cofactor-binding domain-containing protein [Ketobacter sp. MCCC 1A13808]MVF13026.1 xanthine dehydrogenase family protein molybdopterin-binding subunit [Ketobacter sp. MCCC 1A13808]RLP53892.1 MAG: xanthine dehydrogenase family protein molybdopterin-binding subunit [Ketobacter sp.]